LDDKLKGIPKISHKGVNMFRKDKPKKSLKHRILKRFAFGLFIIIFINYCLDWFLDNIDINLMFFGYNLGGIIKSILFTIINLLLYTLFRVGVLIQ
jgi:hypothetical protein